jgi:hypothetical protein
MIVVIICLHLFAVSFLVAGDQTAADTSTTVPAILPGAIELGLAGSLTAVDAVASASLTLRSGSFLRSPSGLVGYELDLFYAHVNLYDQLGLEGRLTWNLPLHGATTLPYVVIGGGLRQEWIGSFSQIRFPAGGGLGFRAMMGRDVAFRCEYIMQRILGDPIQDYNEHRIELGISLLLEN